MPDNFRIFETDRFIKDIEGDFQEEIGVGTSTFALRASADRRFKT